MEISKTTIKKNKLKKTKIKTINQSDLTSDCWSIQFWGISACDKCKFLDTPRCGGKKIRKLILDGKYPIDGLPDQK